MIENMKDVTDEYTVKVENNIQFDSLDNSNTKKIYYELHTTRISKERKWDETLSLLINF